MNFPAEGLTRRKAHTHQAAKHGFDVKDKEGRILRLLWARISVLLTRKGLRMIKEQLRCGHLDEGIQIALRRLTYGAQTCPF